MADVESSELIKNIPTKTVSISKIVYDERNPNHMTAAQMSALDQTIQKYGFASEPWLNEQADGTYMVIDGEHRVRLLELKGIKTVRAKIFNLSYGEVQILRQVANKLRGTHDRKADAQEFKDIADAGQLEELANMLAVQAEDFHRILEKEFDYHFEDSEGEMPNVPKIPKSKVGEIYQLGPHKIMCGDSTDAENHKKLLGKKLIGLIWTDPPYNVSYEQGKYQAKDIDPKSIKFKPLANDDMSEEDFKKFIMSVFVGLAGHMDKTVLYCCSPTLQSSLTMYSALIDSKFHIQSQIVWDKTQAVVGRNDYHWQHEILWYGYSGNPHYWCGSRSLGTVWQIKREPLQAYVHPTQKPIELPRKAIKNSSLKGDLVFDPFLGSGTTLMAAEQTGRICYGMELEPHYVDVIIARWENYTGKKAKRLQS